MTSRSDIHFYDLWMQELEESAEFFLNSYNTKVTAKVCFEIEKRIATCFLHLRQNSKEYLSASRKNQKEISLTYYPIRNIKAKKNDYRERYSLMNGSKELLKVYQLCHSIIHVSEKSQFIPTEEGVLGVFFSSDQDVNEKLYYVQLCKIAQILLSVVENRELIIEPVFNERARIFSFTRYYTNQ